MDRFVFFLLLLTGVRGAEYEFCGGDVDPTIFQPDEVHCIISIGVPCNSSGIIKSFGYPNPIESPNLGEYIFDLLACPGELVILHVDSAEFKLGDSDNFLEIRDGSPSYWTRPGIESTKPSGPLKIREDFPIIRPVLCGGSDELPDQVSALNYTSTQFKMALKLVVSQPGAAFKIHYSTVRAFRHQPQPTGYYNDSSCFERSINALYLNSTGPDNSAIRITLPIQVILLVMILQHIFH